MIHENYFDSEFIAVKQIPNIRLLYIIYSVCLISFLYFILINKNYLLVHSLWWFLIIIIFGILEYFKYRIICKLLSPIKQIYHNFFDFSATFLYTTLICHLLTIIFGANITEDIRSTFIFSCTLVTLSIVPLFFYKGRNCIWSLCINELPTEILEKSVMLTSISTIIGAWFAAVVIPLDWDKSWQIWPIPCVIGSFTGYTVGHLISLYLLCLYNNKRRIL